MDFGVIWTAVGSIAAVAAAVVAIVQAASARASKRDAAKSLQAAENARDESVRLAGLATAAFIRQADAQEKANVLKEAEMTPPTWTGPRWVQGDMYRFTNTSGRSVKLETIGFDPDEASSGVRLLAASDGGVYGDKQSFDLMYRRDVPLSPRGFILTWRYLNEPDGEPKTSTLPV